MCREFGVNLRELRLAHHGFNTTFRAIGQDGRSYALRININSGSGKGQLLAEVEWIRALSTDGRVGVAEPRPTLTGDFVVYRPGPLGRDVPCVMYGWLPGPLATKAPTTEMATLLGKATAELHRHAASWKPPEHCKFKALPDLLYGQPYLLPKRDAFMRILELSERLFERLQQSPRIPIHYDLHPNNAKLYRKRLSIFDFDDAVLAWPVLDASVTLHSLRNFPNALEMENAYWNGLGKFPSDFGLSDPDFEALIAARTLLLANAILSSVNSESAATALAFVDRTERRLEAFHTSGRFDPKVL